MTLASLAAAAVALVLGARSLASAAFALAAAASVALPEPLAAVAFWTCATGAFVAATASPGRELGLAALGLAAALVAAMSANAAIVPAAWVLASAAAAASRPVPTGRIWSAGVVAADVPFVAAVGWAVFQGGFVSWRDPLPVVCGLGLAATALVKALMAGHAEGRAAGPALVVVRGQALAALVLASYAGVSAGHGLLLGGAAAFAAATALRSRAAADAVREMGLTCSLIGAALLGRHPLWWVWAALGAGTCLHFLHLQGSWETSSPRDRTSPAPEESRLGRLAKGPGLGSPIWAGGAVAVLAAVRTGGLEGAVVAAILLLGIAGTVRAGPGRRLPKDGPTRFVSGAVGAAAAMTGLLGLALASSAPPGSAGFALRTGPLLALVGVLAAAAVAGPLAAVLLGPADPPAEPVAPVTPVRELDPRLRRLRDPLLRLAARPAPEWTVAALVSLFAAVSVAIWVAGFLRGFL
ncbi:MAG TPA: hypothetical protein VNE62_10085 [Actinomycetota bacterium]|nr:hypothetical protein [Actinomycetota bacterium]